MKLSRTMVAFDFDGTIVDTELAELEAWKAVEARYAVSGIAHRVRRAIIHGPQHDPVELAREVAVKVNVPAYEVNSCYRRALLGHPSLHVVRPEALELLHLCRAAGHRLTICSGATYAWIGSFLQSLDLHPFFESACTREAWEPNHQKADVYSLMKCHYTGQGVSHFFAVEDSPRGVYAASQGGWHPILLPNALILGEPALSKSLPEKIVLPGRHFLEKLRRGHGSAL